MVLFCVPRRGVAGTLYHIAKSAHGRMKLMPDSPETTSRDRPTSNPGGMECEKCGCIFVGAEWHQFCRVCVEEVAAEIAKVQHG